MFIYAWKWQFLLLSLNIYRATDSELVMWMKAEKVLKYIEVWKALKFSIYKLLEYK